MSDIAYLGRNISSFDSVQEYDGYTRVVIIASEDVEYIAGETTGRTLTLECPWGTQKMAENILKTIKGFQYQPYTANGAALDPAAELGDGVYVNNVYGGIYSVTTKFGGMFRSEVSAPATEDIDHEFPYVKKQDRKINRQIRGLTTELKVQAGLISAEIDERKSDVERINTQLELQSGQITAKVSKTGGSASSFGWILNDSSWSIQANNRDILKATKSGLEVYGKITATSGQIGGFAIASNYLSYNNQTWGGTNTSGIYIGPNGIQLGKNFKVDASGNLTAATGTFTGSVNAGNISYGGSAGYFAGGGISSGSISGSKLKANTITTDYTSSGINSALNDGIWAANLFSGVRDYNASIMIGTVSCVDLYQGGYGFSKKSVTIKDYNGNNITLAYWGW